MGMGIPVWGTTAMSLFGMEPRQPHLSELQEQHHDLPAGILFELRESFKGQTLCPMCAEPFLDRLFASDQRQCKISMDYLLPELWRSVGYEGAALGRWWAIMTIKVSRFLNSLFKLSCLLYFLFIPLL